MHASAMISRCQRLLGDPHGDFHLADAMLEYLNMALSEIADRARYLHVPAYLPLREGQAWYTLPSQFLSTDLVVMRGVPYPLAHTPFAQILPWLYADAAKGTPQCYDIFGNGVDERFTARIETADTAYVSFMEEPRLRGAEWRRGDLIINIDNDNLVSELTTGLETVSGGFSVDGGANYGHWDGGIPGREPFVAGDVVRVVSPNASLKSIVLSPTPDTTDIDGRESLFLFAAMRPQEITEDDIEKSTDVMELDVELETPLQHLIMFYARVAQHGEESPSALTSQANFETSLFRVLPRIRRRVREWKSGYRDRFAKGWFQDRTIVDNTAGAGQAYFLSRQDVPGPVPPTSEPTVPTTPTEPVGPVSPVSPPAPSGTTPPDLQELPADARALAQRVFNAHSAFFLRPEVVPWISLLLRSVQLPDVRNFWGSEAFAELRANPQDLPEIVAQFEGVDPGLAGIIQEALPLWDESDVRAVLQNPEAAEALLGYLDDRRRA